VILETATITVQAGQEEQFVAALEQAKAVLADSPGWQSIQVFQGIERPDTFRLLISWATLADHTETFRGGESFTRWRAIIGPYFAAPPDVEHWTERV
jgi:heme-degrading monooxygenase HmoA